MKYLKNKLITKNCPLYVQKKMKIQDTHNTDVNCFFFLRLSPLSNFGYKIASYKLD